LALGSAPRSQVEGVNAILRDRQATLLQLKSNLKAQERMNKNEDKHRVERRFSSGDWVYIKIQTYRQIIIGGVRNQKLSPKFYGPFEVIKYVGHVTYKLNLLSGPKYIRYSMSKLGNAYIPSPLSPVHCFLRCLNPSW
jgi:hypothetical protein